MSTSNHATIQPLSLEGTAYQRGLAHGETLRAKIQELVRIWQAELSVGFEMDAGEVIRRLLQRTNFVDAILKWTPDLLDEVRGIADGCGLSFDTMLAFQLLDELWANGDLIAVGPQLVQKLKGQHGIERQPAAVGDAPHFVEQVGRPLLHGADKIGPLEESVDDLTRIHLEPDG